MGGINRLMKEHGYVVTMAPPQPQSYLNFNNSNFSRFVTLTVPYAFLAVYSNYIDLVSMAIARELLECGHENIIHPHL